MSNKKEMAQQLLIRNQVRIASMVWNVAWAKEMGDPVLTQKLTAMCNATQEVIDYLKSRLE